MIVCRVLAVVATAAALVGGSASAQPPAPTAPSAPRAIPGMVDVPRFKMQIRDFVVAAEVQPGSPAQKAGMKSMMSLSRSKTGGRPSADFTNAVRALPPKHVLRLVVRRGRANVNVSVTLDDWDAAKSPADTPADKRPRIGLGTQTFLLVQKSDDGGVGRKLGLVQGEQILATHKGTTQDAADFVKAVAETPADQPFYVLYKRAGEKFASRLNPNGDVFGVPEDQVWARAT